MTPSVPASFPSSFSNQQFVGDLASLFERRKLRGNGASLDRFAAELTSSHALRSDLFALCSAISHLSAEDLSADELLALVAQALHRDEDGADRAVEIPEGVRTTFEEAWQQWSRRRSVEVASAGWVATRAAEMFGAPLAEGEGSARAENPEETLPTIQAALGMARRRLPGDLSELNVGAMPEEACRDAVQPEAAPGRGRPSLRLVVACTFLLAMTGGFAGGYAYEALRSGQLQARRAYAPLNGVSGPAQQAGQGTRAETAGDGGAATESASRVAGADRTKTAVPRKMESIEAGRNVLPRLDRKADVRSAAGAARGPATAPAQDAKAPAMREESDLADAVSGVPHVPWSELMADALWAPTPVYPADQPRGVSGTVMVEVSISREGAVTGAWALSGPEQLRPAAIRAVEEWRFRPHLMDGIPAGVTTTVGFFFNGR